MEPLDTPSHLALLFPMTKHRPRLTTARTADTTPRNPRGQRMRQLRLVETSLALRDAPPAFDERGFAARELVQATLPHRQPAGDPPVWSRNNGSYSLIIRPGYRTDPHTGQIVCVGYPFGVIPRLLLFWLTTEAVRTKERRINLGDNLSAFLRELGLSPATGNGPRSDARRLREQMNRLFSASISFEQSRPGSDTWVNMTITSAGHLWWSPTHPDQGSLFGSWIELSDKFYTAITAHPIPVDIRALHALKDSPLALDLYAFLSYRLFMANRSGRAVTIPWRPLLEQLGAAYSTPKAFKQNCLVALRKIRALYPNLPAHQVEGGLRLEPGPLLVANA